MAELTDERIETLAVKHEAFGFGRVDERGLSTHGFDPDGLRDFARAIAAEVADQGEAVAWFAFADNNGPVPLELYGWDEKACRHAVLMSARATGWKGTIEGYLLARGWTIRPLYTRPAAPGEVELLTTQEIKEVFFPILGHAYTCSYLMQQLAVAYQQALVKKNRLTVSAPSPKGDQE